MSPSFSTKRGVRYRFYVSSAVISGRRNEAGSMPRISAPDLENSIVSALHERFAQSSDNLSDQNIMSTFIERVVVSKSTILITLKADVATKRLIELARAPQPLSPCARIENEACEPIREPDVGLMHALARAHLWREALSDGTYQSVEELAGVAKWNPKVVRKALRLAFLAPDITEAIMLGTQPTSLSVSELQGTAAYSWAEQRRLLRFAQST
jgi:hypothetical protein